MGSSGFEPEISSACMLLTLLPHGEREDERGLLFLQTGSGLPLAYEPEREPTHEKTSGVVEGFRRPNIQLGRLALYIELSVYARHVVYWPGPCQESNLNLCSGYAPHVASWKKARR